MCKYLILLLLSFDGQVIKEKYEFARPMNVYECMDFGSDHREQIELTMMKEILGY